MNSSPLNGTTLNGGGSYASIVYLPAATATVELSLNERIAVSMDGTLDMHVSMVGDIYRVSNLGGAPTGTSFEMTGTLVKSPNVSLGTGYTEITATLVGTLSSVALGPPGACAWGTSLTGTMDPRVYLVGSSTQSFDATGTMRITTSPGAATAGMGMASSGSLSIMKGLAGTASSNLNMTGALSRTVFMGGSTSLSWDTSASISNNSSGKDLDQFLMTRRAINREMTR